MKKFTLKAITLATASICGSAAFAGTITSPTVGTMFAVESMTNAIPITVPAITYSMGVARTMPQDFTVLYRPVGGASFPLINSCPEAAVAFAPSAFFAVSNKRSGPTECAYEVDVIADSAIGDEFTISGLSLINHGLASDGATASVAVGLWELSENARIDNLVDRVAPVATSGHALRLVATQDTGTTTDVDHPDGPLFGFVDQNDDTSSTATASFVILNNPGGVFMTPDGVTPWNMATHGTSITVSVPGNFTGADEISANGFGLNDVGSPAVIVGPGGANFTLVNGDFAATGSYSIAFSFTSAETASLGTSRTFGVSAVGDVLIGADVEMAGNASWWVWGANASQLVSNYFNTNPNYITRFFFLNMGASEVSYSVQCYTEGGGAVTNGAGGSLAGNATTNIVSADICTFPADKPRGAVVFTINSPIENIKGTFQQISPNGTDGVVQPLTRPYGKVTPISNASVE